MTKRNKIITIAASLLSVVIILTTLYFVAGNRVKNTLNPVPTSKNIGDQVLPPIPTQTTTSQQYAKYTSKKYGFSFSYWADPNTVIEETPNRVTFRNGAEGQWYIGVDVEPTTFTDPGKKLAQINKDITTPDSGVITVIDKHIFIDGYPALVTSQVSTNGRYNDVDSENKFVYFIKDKQLFTISTWTEDDALLSSFKFIK